MRIQESLQGLGSGVLAAGNEARAARQRVDGSRPVQNDGYLGRQAPELTAGVAPSAK